MHRFPSIDERRHGISGGAVAVGSIVGLTVMWWYLVRWHPDVRTDWHT